MFRISHHKISCILLTFITLAVSGATSFGAGRHYKVKSVRQMSVREKVGQLFNIRPENLCTGTDSTFSVLSDAQRRTFTKYPCGGFTLFARNVRNPEQLERLTSDLHRLMNYPLICVDEEGGKVVRIACNPKFDVPRFVCAGGIGASLNPKDALTCGKAIGEYLSQYGFDVDFAPVADVNSNPSNPVIGTRAFGPDPEVVAEMSLAFLKGLRENHVEGCYKHFPGHGDTSTDTHICYAESSKTWDEMLECEIIPFKKGISKGVSMIMVSHISTPKVTSDSLPSSLSKAMIIGKLRKELHYKGLIITDGMGMKAVSAKLRPGEAAIRAINAGADIILLPPDYTEAFESVYNAVLSGQISMKRLDESVSRIIAFKKSVIRQKR